jgi:hypothetical protein
MERKTRMLVNYSQEGHYMYPEDTWDDSCTISNKKDLLITCKEWHKMSSSKFNNYPLGGLFSFENISFQKQNLIIDDSGEVFYGEITDCDIPEYFEEVKSEFNQWLNFLKERVPKLREVRKNRIEKEKELKKLEELSLKYGNKNY